MKENNYPIFRSSDTFSNMRKERFVVPQPTTLLICNEAVLTKEKQKETVRKLVDRRPDWLDLTDEEQKEEIKAVLVLQTVAEYLYAKGYIQSDCTMFENGFDAEGNVVLDAFYVKDTSTLRGIKRQMKKKEEEAKKEKTTSFVSLSEFRKKKEGK